MSHDTHVTSEAEEWFAQLADLVSSYGAADERTRRNVALARSLSSRAGECCSSTRTPGHGARIVFPLVRMGSQSENRFVVFPLVYAVFRLESRFLSFLEIVEGYAPPFLVSHPQTLAGFDSALVSLGHSQVIVGASVPSSTRGLQGEPLDPVLLQRVRRSILKASQREAGATFDMRFSCAVLPGVPPCGFGDEPRDRFFPAWSDGACTWRRWNTCELSAADVAQLQI